MFFKKLRELYDKWYENWVMERHTVAPDDEDIVYECPDCRAVMGCKWKIKDERRYCDKCILFVQCQVRNGEPFEFARTGERVRLFGNDGVFWVESKEKCFKCNSQGE